MKRTLLFGLLTLALVVATQSCKQDDSVSYQNHAMNQKTTVGFYYGNDFTSTFTYRAYQFQYAYGSSDQGYLYRLSHSTDLRTVQLDGIPQPATPNAEFEADLTIAGFGNMDYQGSAQCVVTQVQDNKVWILDKDHNYGFIVEYK